MSYLHQDQQLTLWVNQAFQDELHSAPDTFGWFMSLEGQSVRRVEKRDTLRVQLPDGEGFIKKHFGLSWGDILGDLLRLRRPVLGARNEFEAILHANQAGIRTPEPLAFGVKGWWPTRQQSFLLTRSLGETRTLNELFRDGASDTAGALPLDDLTRRAIIDEVARIVRRMHDAGMNHRDLYLPHFRYHPQDLQTGSCPPLFLMDLHRAQRRAAVPMRWLVKDLAALHFSARLREVSDTDTIRFLKVYFSATSLREVLSQHGSLLEACRRKSQAMWQHHQKREARRRQKT